MTPLGYILCAMTYVAVMLVVQAVLRKDYEVSEVKSWVLAACWPGPVYALLLILATVLHI